MPYRHPYRARSSERHFVACVPWAAAVASALGPDFRGRPRRTSRASLGRRAAQPRLALAAVRGTLIQAMSAPRVGPTPPAPAGLARRWTQPWHCRVIDAKGGAADARSAAETRNVRRRRLCACSNTLAIEPNERRRPAPSSAANGGACHTSGDPVDRPARAHGEEVALGAHGACPQNALLPKNARLRKVSVVGAALVPFGRLYCWWRGQTGCSREPDRAIRRDGPWFAACLMRSSYRAPGRRSLATPPSLAGAALLEQVTA